VRGNALTINSIRLGNSYEIRIFHIGKRITFVEEHLLPLANHTKEVIVEDNDLYPNIFLKDSSQFLNGHLNAAIATKQANSAMGSADFGTNGRRQTESHGSQSSRSNHTAGL
jgi:hypothetical protein